MTDGTKPPEADRGGRNAAPLVFLVVAALIVFSVAITWNVSRGLDQMRARQAGEAGMVDAAAYEPAALEVESPEAALELLEREGQEEISFSATSIGVHLLTSGWLPPDEVGVWVGGSKGRLLLPADVAGLPVESVRLDFVAFAPPGITQAFRFSVNGGEVGRASVAPREGTMIPGSSVTLSLPATSSASPLVFEIEVERPISPADAGVGPDVRKLGFRLNRVVLNPPDE